MSTTTLLRTLPASQTPTDAMSWHRLGLLLRWWLLGLSVLGFSLLAGLNWALLNTELSVNLVFAQAQLPLGLLALGLGAALWILGLVALGLLRSHPRPDTARLLTELRQLSAAQAQAQAAQTEALRQAVKHGLEPLQAELARLQPRAPPHPQAHLQAHLQP